MSRTEVVQGGCFSDGGLPAHRGPTAQQRSGAPHCVREVLGNAAWGRLPKAVQLRFADEARAVDYAGEFEVVRASLIGKIIAWACQIFGTPVVPRTGCNVPAIVRVGPSPRGVTWCREYRWPGRSPCLVQSTKVINSDGTLVEELPALLCMSLNVYEQGGALHFVSRAYYFDIAIPRFRSRLCLALPLWLSPGTTHVEHIDEVDGWFRFTMTVTHPLFGEVFYQTGRFHALGD